MKRMILVVVLIILSATCIVTAQETVSAQVYLDGKQIEPDGIMAMYKMEDGSYAKPEELDKEGRALVLAMEKNSGGMYCFSKETDLRTGVNRLEFNSSEMKESEIVIGSGMNIMGGKASVFFENLPEETRLDVEVAEGKKTRIYTSDGLTVDHVALVQVMGNTGINMSRKGEYGFDSNFYLKLKSDFVLMNERPSFDDIFEICFSKDVAIDGIFLMGQNGGCDYKYYDGSGNVVLEGRFGDTGNGLHFENLQGGSYDMEFHFHGGDLVLTAQDILFAKEEKTVEKPESLLVINAGSLPLSGSKIDFHELMSRDEKKIVFYLDIKDQIDGNILNQNDIDLFSQSGKEFSIRTPFIQVDFDRNTIAEMDKTNRDLSMHIKNGRAFSAKEETERFLNKTYAGSITDDMEFIADYEVMIFLSEHDLIGGDFANRPELTFFPYEEYLKGRDIRKMSVFSDIGADNVLDSIGGTERDGGIVLKPEKPVPYHYFNLYERNVVFTDTVSSWAKDYIEVMAAKNIINGVGKDLYKPKEKLTKAQYLALLIRAIDADLPGYEGIYDDCKETDWFTPYVESADKLGIIEDTADNLLHPNTELSRQDMAVMTVKAYKELNGSIPWIEAVKTFTDEKDINSHTLDFVKTAVQLELISGMPDGSFQPHKTLTREEAAKMIYLLLQKTK
jgi:hypothetical protein